jgi:hypothetical protein
MLLLAVTAGSKLFSSLTEVKRSAHLGWPLFLFLIQMGFLFSAPGLPEKTGVIGFEIETSTEASAERRNVRFLASKAN